jgi:hypothetical protein
VAEIEQCRRATDSAERAPAPAAPAVGRPDEPPGPPAAPDLAAGTPSSELPTVPPPAAPPIAPDDKRVAGFWSRIKQKLKK